MKRRIRTLQASTMLFALAAGVQAFAAVSTGSWSGAAYALVALGMACITQYSTEIIQRQRQLIRMQSDDIEVLRAVNDTLRNTIFHVRGEPQRPYDWQDDDTFHDPELSKRFYSVIDPDD